MLVLVLFFVALVALVVVGEWSASEDDARLRRDCLALEKYGRQVRVRITKTCRYGTPTPQENKLKITDKLKAVVAAFGTLAATAAAAAEDSTINGGELAGIVVAALAVGAAVWAVRNKPAA